MTRDASRTLKPDAAWLLRFKEPPISEMEALVNAWLDLQGAPLLGDQITTPSTLVQVRDHNRNFLSGFIRRALPILLAWCVKFQPEMRPDALIEKDGINDLRKRLDRIGVLDFCMPDDTSAAKWRQILNLWPVGMHHSVDLNELKPTVKKPLGSVRLGNGKERSDRDLCDRATAVAEKQVARKQDRLGAA